MITQIRNFSIDKCSSIEPSVQEQRLQALFTAKNNYWDGRF